MMGVMSRFALPLWFLLAPLSGATAAPSADFVTAAFVAAIEASGDMTASYETASMSDGTLTITGLKLVATSGANRAVSLPRVAISDIVERETGGFMAGRFVFDGGALNDGNRRIAWETALAEGVAVPGPDEIKSAARIRPLQRLSMSALSLTKGPDTPLIRIGELRLDIDEVVEGEPSRIVLDATDMWVVADLAGGVRRRALLRALGFSEINLDLHLVSTIDLEADTWAMRPLEMRVEDMGNFRINGQFSGISLGGFATASRQQAAREAARLDNLAVRFENGGLVERALDMQAAMMGVERDQFVEQFLGAVPFMLNFIGNPPFQAKLATVANEFLRDPRTLTISSLPATPVPLLDVAGAAVTNRSILPDLLAVQVLANN